MSQEWSISDTTKGARTIEKIARLASTKQHKLNCNQKALFSLIPIYQVVIEYTPSFSEDFRCPNHTNMWP